MKVSLLFLWAIVMGLLSVSYLRAIGWAQTHKPKGWQLIALPPLIFTTVGIAATKFRKFSAVART